MVVQYEGLGKAWRFRGAGTGSWCGLGGARGKPTFQKNSRLPMPVAGGDSSDKGRQRNMLLWGSWRAAEARVQIRRRRAAAPTDARGAVPRLGRPPGSRGPQAGQTRWSGARAMVRAGGPWLVAGVVEPKQQLQRCGQGSAGRRQGLQAVRLAGSGGLASCRAFGSWRRAGWRQASRQKTTPHAAQDHPPTRWPLLVRPSVNPPLTSPRMAAEGSRGAAPSACRRRGEQRGAPWAWAWSRSRSWACARAATPRPRRWWRWR